MENNNQITKDEKMWGMLCHLSALVGYITGFGFILGPLIIWLIKKDESAFVDEQGKEALNFQLSITIYAIISSILIFIIIGALFLIVLAAMQLVFIIIASVQANDGKSYRYPLTIRFIK